jgi:hypothetical protein
MRQSSQKKLFVVLCLISLTALSYLGLDAHSDKLQRKLRFELEAGAVSQAIFEGFNDPRSCTRAVKTLFRIPPDLSAPVLLTNVYRFADKNSEVFIARGEEVSRLLRIQRMALRPFDATRDSAPGPKIEVELEALDENLSGIKLTRTHDLFVAKKALASDPNYHFQCSTLPLSSMAANLQVALIKDLDCQSTSPRTLTCPQGLRPIHCSMRVDVLQTFDDEFHCQVSSQSRECTFTHSQVGESCELIDAQCQCL